MRVVNSTLIPVGQLSKVSVDHNCHSERGEESRSYKKNGILCRFAPQNDIST
jgi:hypothetical protein